MVEVTTADLERDGREALSRGRWAEAKKIFERCLEITATPSALEGLGEALWWLCDAQGSVRMRERAFVAHRAAGDRFHACRTAIDLTICYLINLGNPAAAAGWLARGERLFGSDEDNPLQGWLWLMRGFMGGDYAAAHGATLPNDEGAGHAYDRALQFARDTGDTDLELIALADSGVALILAGRVKEGMALLDEAMAGTFSGECRRLDTVVFNSCNMLAACSLVGDLDRAAQWCRVADDFMSTYSCPFLFTSCRAHYGGLLAAKGSWPQAEAELEAALGMSEDAAPSARSEAVSRLAELRFRQGRLEESEALLANAPDDISGATTAAALLLFKGETSVAISVLERKLRSLPPRHIDVGRTLALLVDAYIAAGAMGQADDAAARLAGFASHHDSDQARALTALSKAHLIASQGAPEDAITELQTALDLFVQLELPLEVARVRIELAEAHARIGPEIAISEARTALASLEELGATLDADRAASLLRSLGARRRPGPKDVGLLTERELEVLELLKGGSSNPEIASRLFISRKTASHHVSSILQKLGLRNRAEAAAYATRIQSPP